MRFSCSFYPSEELLIYSSFDSEHWHVSPPLSCPLTSEDQAVHQPCDAYLPCLDIFIFCVSVKLPKGQSMLTSSALALSFLVQSLLTRRQLLTVEDRAGESEDRVDGDSWTNYRLLSGRIGVTPCPNEFQFPYSWQEWGLFLPRAFVSNTKKGERTHRRHVRGGR
jgi:hypothetical protein